jgi:hypothetical protein
MNYKTLFFILIFITISGCKPKQILVPVTETKIEYRDNLRVDSIYNRDTLFVFRQNDTVYIQSVKWRERFKIDTLRYERLDSVPYAVEVIKEVNKLTKWQDIRLTLFNILVAILGGYIVYKIGSRLK